MSVKPVNLTVRQAFIAAIVAALVGGVLVVGGAAIVMSKRPVTESTTAVGAPATTTVTVSASASSTARPAADVEATEIVPGTGDDPGEAPTVYRCKAVFKTVQVPIGQTIQADGAKYVLAETKASYGDQVSVTLSITLPAGVSAPAIVVNAADHKVRPDLWGNSVLKVDLRPGGTGNWNLATKAYAHLGTLFLNRYALKSQGPGGYSRKMASLHEAICFSGATD